MSLVSIETDDPRYDIYVISNNVRIIFRYGANNLSSKQCNHRWSFSMSIFIIGAIIELLDVLILVN